MGWDVRYCDEVETWLDSLDTRQLKSVAKELKMLEIAGHELRLPHSKSLGSGLFELRERQYGLRVYYTFDKGRVVILLCAGDKKTQQRDIERAKSILNTL